MIMQIYWKCLYTISRDISFAWDMLYFKHMKKYLLFWQNMHFRAEWMAWEDFVRKDVLYLSRKELKSLKNLLNFFLKSTNYVRKSTKSSCCNEDETLKTTQSSKNMTIWSLIFGFLQLSIFIVKLLIKHRNKSVLDYRNS